MTYRAHLARIAALPLALAAYPLSALSQTNPATLPETRVSATRFEETARSLPFGVSVITAQEIRDAGINTVNEALMRLLGVVGRQDFYGGDNFGLDLRGFGTTADSNQVVIVDGQRLSEYDQGRVALSGISIDSVERIEVIRGSGAVLYGEGATAGAIVITTRAGLQGNAASLYGAAGSNGLREGRVTASVAGGGFSLDFA
ncbi:MAG: TonB-dependent receptor, partial [Burkholderiales bacterium]